MWKLCKLNVLETTWSLGYNTDGVRVDADVPVVGVELGSNINASYIREGMDVYFECSVTANPKVRKVTWLHNVSQLKYYLSQQLLLPFHSQKKVRSLKL